MNSKVRSRHGGKLLLHRVEKKFSALEEQSQKNLKWQHASLKDELIHGEVEYRFPRDEEKVPVDQKDAEENSGTNSDAEA